jgi:two-component system, OmpR family, response regulator
MRLLVVEDEPEILLPLRVRLKSEGFIVDIANDGAKGSTMAKNNIYDVIILDYMLPKKSGAKICQEIRANGIITPIIIISVQGAAPTKIELLNLGADDYLVKPFSFEELLARIRAVMRRPQELKKEVLNIDDLTLDTVRCRVERAGKEIKLTRKEFGLLEYLLRNKGTVISRGTIMEHVWDVKGDLFSNTIETHILNLRKKLQKYGGNKLIHTISGRGYKIDLEK